MPSSLTSMNAKYDAPERKLILGTCRLVLGQDNAKELREILTRGINEDFLFDLCDENRLLLLVYRHAILPNRDLLTPDFVAKFERKARRKTLWHLPLSRWVVDTHRSFDERKIPHLYLKGPVLNDMLFPNQVLRYSKDVDIVVAPDRMMGADIALREMGFLSDRSPAWIRRYMFWGRFGRRNIIYTKPGFRHQIELHWKRDEVNAFLSPTGHRWEDNMKTVSFHAEEIPVLADLENCLSLCLHGASRNWSRMIWLLDIVLLMKTHAIEPRRLMAVASSHGLDNVVLEALILREKIFGGDWREVANQRQASITRVESRLRRRIESAATLRGLALRSLS